MAATATESSALLPDRVLSSCNGSGRQYANGGQQPNGQQYANGYLHEPKQSTGEQHILHICKEHTDIYEPILGWDDYACGLTLEELLPYLDDPWWQRLRQLLFGAFWLTFLLVLMTACTLAMAQHDLPCTAVNLAPDSSPIASDAPSRNAMAAP